MAQGTPTTEGVQQIIPIFTAVNVESVAHLRAVVSGVRGSDEEQDEREDTEEAGPRPDGEDLAREEDPERQRKVDAGLRGAVAEPSHLHVLAEGDARATEGLGGDEGVFEAVEEASLPHPLHGAAVHGYAQGHRHRHALLALRREVVRRLGHGAQRPVRDKDRTLQPCGEGVILDERKSVVIAAWGRRHHRPVRLRWRRTLGLLAFTGRFDCGRRDVIVGFARFQIHIWSHCQLLRRW